MNLQPANSRLLGPQSSPLSKRAQAGVSLIEILIAVLVLSIGLLGLAALQTRALSNTGSSSAQTMATLASYSILDAMRLDKVNALAGNYNQTVTANNCAATGTPLAIAQLNAWCSLLGNSLSATASTTGVVSCQAIGTCTVTIQFDNSKATGGISTQTVITKAAL